MPMKRIAALHLQPGMLYAHHPRHDGLTLFRGFEWDPRRIDRAWGGCEPGSYIWKSHRDPGKLWLYTGDNNDPRPYWMGAASFVWVKEEED